MAITQNYVDYGAGNDTTGDGTVGAPWKTLQKAFDTVTRNTTDGNQINLKAGTAHVNAAALDLTTFIGGGALSANGPLIVRGYTSAADDGGRAEIDCNGATMWAAATYDQVLLMDLNIHTFGDHDGIVLDTYCALIRCEVSKGASSPSGKKLVSLGNPSRVFGCYLHDDGAGAAECLLVAANSHIVGNLFANGALSTGFAVETGADPVVVNNNILCSAAAHGGLYTSYGAFVANNNVYNSAAGTNRGIYVIGSGVSTTFVNNIVVGWSGAGGDALQCNSNVGMLGWNAFYNNTANYTIADQKFVDLTANDVTLGAEPFTDAANGDFSLTTTAKAALRSAGWPAAYLGAHANTDGHVSIGAMQYGESEAAADYPAETDVRNGVTYDAYTGSLDLPAVADVQSGVTYDGATKTGTFAAPAVGDVQSGVTYGAAAEYTGTLTLPTEAHVEEGIGYGDGGTEFTGELVVGSDWTDGEKEQIRKALGVTGTTAATTGTGTLEAAFAALADDTDIAAAVLVAMNATPPAVNVTTLKGETEPLDNLVLALGTGGLVEKLNSMLEAAGLVYRFTAEALAEAPTEAGSGTGTYTDTIKDPSNNPLDGVRVQLSTDAAGAHRVYEAFTNALGVFVMNPDPGTYYRWIDLAGYTDRLTQGAQVTVT